METGYAPRTHVHEELHEIRAQLHEARAGLDETAHELAGALDRIAILESLLDDCRDLLDGYADCETGSGGYHPNTAMRLKMEIGEVLK